MAAGEAEAVGRQLTLSTIMNTSLCNLDNQPAVLSSRHLLTPSRLRTTSIALAGLVILGAIVWSQPSVDLDQYAVYSAFLDAYSSDTPGTRPVVVFDHTVPPNELSTEQTDYVSKQLPELQPETLAAFLDANDQAYSLGGMSSSV